MEKIYAQLLDDLKGKKYWTTKEKAKGQGKVAKEKSKDQPVGKTFNNYSNRQIKQQILMKQTIKQY